MARVRKPDANSQDDRAGYPNTNLGNGQTVRFNRGYPSIAAEIARHGDCRSGPIGLQKSVSS